ncbi:MAG TPA: hypothetical protein VN922_20815 [Bacteroidia bacterium]|nr:hypothetical protein [Bacteroidia bacterium]
MRKLLLLTMPLLLFSCNNGKDEAAKLQHQNDSLKAAMQMQAQQKQLDSLKSTVNKMQQNTDESAKEKQEAFRKQMFTYWQRQAIMNKTQRDYDSATLHNVSEYHLGRMPSTRKQEIANATVKLENDRLKTQQINDSLSKYQ